MTDTIFAVSSGAPPAAIAILRLSGQAAFAVVEQLSGRLPAPRAATLVRLVDPNTRELLDQAIVLVFPGPNSATGEDVAELHVHGGRATIAAIEGVLAAMPGMRRAEAGEFTRRALLNGRIDLTEAEGLGDLLMAETEAQRRAAVASADGSIRRRVEGWVQSVLSLSAEVEAQIDFSDEDDVTEEELAAISQRIADVATEMDAVLREPPVERLRDGVRVVLAGPPNSGKSTLLNVLADRQVAIVTAEAGTTRDRLEAPVVRNGIAYVLTDTAGLRDDPTSEIEAIGIDLSRQAIEESDIVLWLGDNKPHLGAIWLHARADQADRKHMPEGRDLAISANAGLGIAELWKVLANRARTLLPGDGAVAMNRRQRSFAFAACGHLRLASSVNDIVLVAEELRSARDALDQITGQAGTEDMLDALFIGFCIGK